MEKQRRGWWIVGLAAALMAPSLTGPASAGPFDYIQKTDQQKNQSQSQSQQQAQEQQKRQAEAQEQQRRQADERAQQQRQAEARQAQERQRAAQEGARQEQERRAATERQAAETRQRQAAQQAEQQRQAERARAAQEASQRQRAEQERAQQAQQQRLREEQAAQQQARRAQAEQVRRAQEAQAEQAQREQAQPEQVRRAQEAQAAQQQAERVRQEQRRLVRPVASGPFDYIRKADQSKGTPPANAPQAPARPPGPAPAGAPARPQPFNYIPGTIRNNPSVPGSTLIPSTPSVPPGVRPSPFGSVRGGWPSTPTAPRPQVETPRPPRNYGTDGTHYPRTPPANPSMPAPFGSVRSQTAPGTRVTPAPIPRGGHGTLGSYFTRPPRPRRPRRNHPGAYYGYYPYAPGYYYVSPYDLYPPTLYYPYPVPSPAPVYVPEPQIIEVPEPYYVEPSAPSEAEAATLDEVIGDIEEAWESGKLSLLMRHVRPGAELQIYRDGEWVDTLFRSQFEQKTQQAFRDYDTVSMTFEKPELLGPDETGAPRARARATHIYRTRSGGEQRVHVTYAFRKYGSTWCVIGLDYEPTERADAAAAPLPPPAAPAAALAAAPDGRWALVSAPPVRLHDLLTVSQPHTVATVKWLRGGGRSLYTLQAMRGVVPGTIAWALYPKGNKQPAETGVVSAGALPANGWVAVRAQAPQLVTLSSRVAPSPRMALLSTPAFPAAADLALVPAKPPAKSAHTKTGHKRRTTRPRKAHRA